MFFSRHFLPVLEIRPVLLIDLRDLFLPIDIRFIDLIHRSPVCWHDYIRREEKIKQQSYNCCLIVNVFQQTFLTRAGNSPGTPDWSPRSLSPHRYKVYRSHPPESCLLTRLYTKRGKNQAAIIQLLPDCKCFSADISYPCWKFARYSWLISEISFSPSI